MREFNVLEDLKQATMVQGQSYEEGGTGGKERVDREDHAGM